MQSPEEPPIICTFTHGNVEIANSLSQKGSLELVGDKLEVVEIDLLMDTGANWNLVSLDFVASLGKYIVFTPLLRPIRLDGVNGPGKDYVTHTCLLPLRLRNDHFSEETFAIAPLGIKQNLILGLPWLEKHAADSIDILKSFGKALEILPLVDIKPASAAYITMPASEDKDSSAPIPCPPCSSTATAFSAGGVIAAIDSEIFFRNARTEKAVVCLSAIAAITHELDDRHAMLALVASSGPGVRGLTGNALDWLNSIPKMFHQFAHSVFSDEAAAKLPPSRPGFDCVIKLKEGAKLSNASIYNMSSEQLTILKQLLDVELEKGFIEPSDAPHSSPVFFVTDPTTKQLRLVVDYRGLNAQTIFDDYGLPLTAQIMRGLTRARFFTKFDVRAGFSNLLMSPESSLLTTFKTFYGTYKSKVMTMGLATAPATFQRFMNHILAPFLDRFCFVYLDDIIIFSDTQKEHDEHVLQILQTLEKNQLHLKPSKCVWSKQEITFLGFTAVAGQGIRMSDDKVLKITSLPSPRSVTEVRETLGLINFYGHFIPHYSDICAPINALTGKDVPFVWSEKCESAFRRLLSLIKTDVFLVAFDPKLPTTLETDASDVAYGGVISQPGPDGKLRPVVMFHHKFKSHEKNWDIHDKELWAIVYAFDHFRHFLAPVTTPISVITDHRNLAKFMFTTDLLKSHDGRLGRWWTLLSGYNFQIEYRPGSENVVSDFLSRYQQGASVPDGLTLLPAHRFSPKALADISTWFKSAKDKNIRQILEDGFSKKIGSDLPVGPSAGPSTVLSPSVNSTSAIPATAGRFSAICDAYAARIGNSAITAAQSVWRTQGDRPMTVTCASGKGVEPNRRGLGWVA
jgi:hypothetical protein